MGSVKYTVLLMALSGTLISCSSDLPCNRIAFDNPSDVENSLKDLRALFEANPKLFGRGYYYTEQMQARIVRGNQSEVVGLDTLFDAHRSEMVRTLSSSGIYGLFRWEGGDQWYAPYCRPNADFEALRLIILAPDPSSHNETELMGHKILDTWGHMVLVAPVP
jgi:hypothetical protein